MSPRKKAAWLYDLVKPYVHQIDRYLDRRQHEKATNGTTNRELALLKRAFNLGRECKPPKVHNVPYLRMLKENNMRTGFLGSAQYDRLARACAEYSLWMRTLFEIGYTYGWRREESLTMRVKQVFIVDRIIRLNPGETKNDEGREVTMTPTLRSFLPNA